MRELTIVEGEVCGEARLFGGTVVSNEFALVAGAMHEAALFVIVERWAEVVGVSFAEDV